MRWAIAAACVLVLFAVPVAGQTVTNPTAVQFTASVDHDLASGYILGYFAPGATAPVMESDLGKPTPNAEGICTVALNSRPLGFATGYVAKVRTVAGAVSGEWSEASNIFSRLPGKPGGPVIR